ncbi:MAG: hypothetical protein ABSC94_26885 [Polyangiaceae bacterium]|jgi:hypothetical protein
MDVLTTILTCSLYLADDALVRAIAESTSERNPYFVLDTSVDWTQVDPPPAPKTAADALARTRDILAKGGRPLLGLLEVPPVWLDAFGRDLADAFDPCTNVAVGTAMISAFDVECAAVTPPNVAQRKNAPSAATSAHAPSAARRRCILRKYEEAIGLPDFATATTLELRVQRPIPSPVADAPILVPVPRENAGPASILVPTTSFSGPTSFSESHAASNP